MEEQDIHKEKDVEMMPVGGKKNYDEESFFVPIDVLFLVKTSQNQNGLRNHDYYRYYKYCSRKIHRLRKATKLTQGRRKFVKNDITSEKVKKSQRAVQVPLFMSERDWANAMFLKKQLTEHGDKFIRNKHMARKKMKKAFQSAQLFFDLSKDIWDQQTIVEAEAYVEYMKANLDLEYSKYEGALESLLKISIIYKSLAKSKDALKAAIYNEQIEQIEPLIRLCTHNLQNKTEQDLSNLEKLEDNLNSQQNIAQKVTDSLSGGKRELNEDIISITFQGKSIPLKTPKLKNSFARLETTLAEVQKVKASDDLSLKDKIDNHTHLLHIIEDCLVIIQKEKTEETKKSEASGTLYNLLLGYVGTIKNTSILERCLLKAFAYAEVIPLAQVFTKQKLRAAQRPQIVMKLFDKALKALKKISQENDVLDPEKLTENSHREMIIQVYLKFYIAVHYANEKRYAQSYLITKRARKETQRCLDYAQSKATEEEIEKLKIFNENQIEYMLCKNHAVLLLEQQKVIDNLGKEVEGLNLNEKPKKSSDNILNIVEWLFDNSGNLKDENSKNGVKVELIDGNMNILDTGASNVLFLEEDGESNIDELLSKKIRFNKKVKLIDLVPKLQPVMPKPFFFDVAGDGVHYPNIEETIKEIEGKANQGSGLFGRIKGAFFGN